jgi:hypothetical protein
MKDTLIIYTPDSPQGYGVLDEIDEAQWQEDEDFRKELVMEFIREHY